MSDDIAEGRRPGWISENIPADIQSGLFQFRVKLTNGNTVKVDLRTTIDVDYELLEEELQTTPQHYVWWSSLYSEAKAMVAVVERAIKVRRGVIIEAIQEEMKREGVKLPEKVFQSIVDKDETIGKLEEQLIVAQRTAGKLWHMVKAIEMKSEHLRSLSGFKRQEREQQR